MGVCATEVPSKERQTEDSVQSEAVPFSPPPESWSSKAAASVSPAKSKKKLGIHPTTGSRKPEASSYTSTAEASSSLVTNSRCVSCLRCAECRRVKLHVLVSHHKSAHASETLQCKDVGYYKLNGELKLYAEEISEEILGSGKGVAKGYAAFSTMTTTTAGKSKSAIGAKSQLVKSWKNGLSLSKAVFNILRKSKMDLTDGGTKTLGKLKALVAHRGAAEYWNSDSYFDINWRTDRDDFGIRYVFRHSHWAVLCYLLRDCELHSHTTHALDLTLTDNACLAHNVLHHLVIGTHNSERKRSLANSCSNKCLQILFEMDTLGTERNWDEYSTELPFFLLYQQNTYNRVPSQEAQVHGLRLVAMALEKLKYEHIHETLICGNGIPYDIAHLIIQFTFHFVNWSELTAIRHLRWDQSTVVLF